jgi:hypothetical protein
MPGSGHVTHQRRPLPLLCCVGFLSLRSRSRLVHSRAASLSSSSARAARAINLRSCASLAPGYSSTSRSTVCLTSLGVAGISPVIVFFPRPAHLMLLAAPQYRPLPIVIRAEARAPRGQVSFKVITKSLSLYITHASLQILTLAFAYLAHAATSVT